MKKKILFLFLNIIVIAILIGCSQPESKNYQKIVEIEPTKEIENLPEEYLPLKYDWRLVKGDESSAMHYPSYVPGKPEVKFKVEVSANLHGVLATPLVYDNTVILADGLKIYALSRENGETLWIREIYNEYGRFVETYGRGEYIYIASSSTPGGEGKPVLIALNDNGEVQWEAEFGDKGSKATSNLLVADGKVCTGTVDGNLYCFSEKGEMLWNVHAGGIVRGLAYGEGKLFVTSENQKVIHAYDIKTGENLWKYEHESIVGTPLYKGKVLFADSSGRVVCIDENETILWKRDYGVGIDVNSNSFLAAGREIYASRNLGERPLNLIKIGFDGERAGEFFVDGKERPGTPLVTEDIVLLPVTNSNYSKVYLLWRGFEKLGEIKQEGEEVFMPKISVASGEIYMLLSINGSRAVLYKLSDDEEPVIGNILVALKEEDAEKIIGINTTVKDERSGIHKVLLVYSVNNSDWSYREMELERRYVMEPVGGYGLSEEPYEAKITLKSSSAAQFYIAAIDKLGNVGFSEIYAFKVR